MNVVMVSPHFPPNFYHFCAALRRAGANVFGIADAPYDELRPELQAALTEYYRVPDALDYDQLLRGVAYLTFRHGKMDWLESHNEFWLETDARLRTDFNIPGIKNDLITDIKAKSRMKARFIAAGVPVARGRVVHTPDEARLFIAETGYPVVAKPDIGVGAAHTYRINDDAELARFFEAKPPIDYIMEEFISGVIYSFDGLADREGNPVFYTAHVFSQGIMETVNEDQDLYYHSLREIPADLEDAGRRTLAAFDVRARFFHIEFFRTHRRRRPDRRARSQPATAGRSDDGHVQLRQRGRSVPGMGQRDHRRAGAHVLRPALLLRLCGPEAVADLPPLARRDHGRVRSSDRALRAHEPRLPPGAGGRGLRDAFAGAG